MSLSAWTGSFFGLWGFSHCLIVFFFDYGTVGLWDYGTSLFCAQRPINMRRRHLTFHFSLFSFHFINMRRRHLTFPFSLFSFHFITRRRHLTFHFSPFSFHLITSREAHLTFNFSVFTFHFSPPLSHYFSLRLHLFSLFLLHTTINYLSLH